MLWSVRTSKKSHNQIRMVFRSAVVKHFRRWRKNPHRRLLLNNGLWEGSSYPQTDQFNTWSREHIFLSKHALAKWLMVFRLLIFLSTTYMFQMMSKIEACINWKFLKMPLQNQYSQLLFSSFQERTTVWLKNTASKVEFKRDTSCNYGIILMCLLNSFWPGV